VRCFTNSSGHPDEQRSQVSVGAISLRRLFSGRFFFKVAKKLFPISAKKNDSAIFSVIRFFVEVDCVNTYVECQNPFLHTSKWRHY
jgi:hypothetical protein